MKVGMIAPDVEKDGITKYTEFLTDELREETDLNWIGMEEKVSLKNLIKLSLRGSRYDVIHIQFTPEWWGNFFGYFWGSYLIPFLLLTRSKTIITAHEYEFDHRNALVKKIQELKFRLIYLLADKIIVHNQRGKEYLKRLEPRADVEVIPHGLPEVESTDKDIGMEGKVLLIFGFIRRDKNYEVVLDALEDLPEDYKLLIAGSARTEEDKEYGKQLKKEVKRRGLKRRVNFYGYVPDNEIGKIFNSADVSLLPYECSSGSGVLALTLAYKIPILISDIPLAYEIGLETFSNKEELESKLRKGISAEIYLERIKDLSEDRKWGKVAEKTAEIYQEVIEE